MDHRTCSLGRHLGYYLLVDSINYSLERISDLSNVNVTPLSDLFDYLVSAKLLL